MRIKGEAVSGGKAKGAALISKEPISFFGSIDLETGIVTEPGHPLKGKKLTSTILIFPKGKGSTVGSFALYRLKKQNMAPAGIIMEEAEPIVATGAIISDIPLLHRLEKKPSFKNGQKLILNCDDGYVEEA